jgi:hypothetical protein
MIESIIIVIDFIFLELKFLKSKFLLISKSINIRIYLSSVYLKSETSVIYL